jgi:hypothetical protein
LRIVCGKIRGIRWLEFIGKGVIKEQGSSATDLLSEDVTDLTDGSGKKERGRSKKSQGFTNTELRQNFYM